MDQRPTRWGIISAGLISGDFCLALRTLPATENQIVAVAARSINDAEVFAKRHGIKNTYGSYEELSKDPEVDIVYIGSIHTKHCELSLMMLNAGKHVLCEKPMGMSAAEVKQMITLAEEKQLFFVEGFWSRYFPAYEKLREELKANAVGDVRLLSVQFGYPFKWETKARVGKKELGGGVLLNIGCYGIQLANMVFGKERPEKIVANASLYSTGVDKAASVTLCYKDGRMAQILMSGECNLSNTALVYGTSGTIEIPSFSRPTELRTPLESFQYKLPEPPEPTHYTDSVGFIYEIRAIRKALLEGKTQASEMEHDDSLLIAEIHDEILRQIGLVY